MNKCWSVCFMELRLIENQFNRILSGDLKFECLSMRFGELNIMIFNSDLFYSAVFCSILLYSC